MDKTKNPKEMVITKNGKKMPYGVKFKKTHGMTGTSIYNIWCSMIARCYNTKNVAFKSYGGRGILTSKRWLKFENFYLDMGERPDKKHTLDRRDNNRGYSKSNCRWVTYAQNNRNRRDNRVLMIRGKKYLVHEVCEKFNLNIHTLRKRLYDGWTDHQAALTPTMKGRAYRPTEEII